MLNDPGLRYVVGRTGFADDAQRYVLIPRRQEGRRRRIAGDPIRVAEIMKIVTAAAAQFVIGYALSTVTDGNTGKIFVQPSHLYSAGTATDIATTSAGDAAGDLIYRDAGTTFERLAKGTNAQILAMNVGATAPEWINQSAMAVGTATNLVTTTAGDAAGDLVYRDAGTTFERLAKGTNGQLLAMNAGATAPEWIAQSAVVAATPTNLVTTAAGDAAGDLIYRDAGTTFERLAKGTAGQVLAMNAGATAPEWASVSSDVTMAAGGAMTVGRVLDGSNSADTLSGSVVGATPVLFRKTWTGGATANFDVVVTNKILVTDFWVHLKGLGTAGDTIQLKNTGDAISNAVDINDADQTISRAGTLDDSYTTILAGGTLRLTVTDGGGADVPGGEAYVLAINVA